jgi:hypothetical protein|tara:strand:- start:264 stop:464 length:201 start_codon:yes stop_codon:yes gene_type:complete
MDSLADYLRSKLTEKKDNLAQAISTGSSDSYDEYKYQVGIIEGLTLAIEETKLAEKNIYNDTEEGD